MNSLKENLAAFPLPSQYAMAGNSIRADYENLRKEVQKALKHPGSIKKAFCRLFPKLFHLRLQAILQKPHPFDEQMTGAEALYAKISRSKIQLEGIESLSESVRFAMRVHDRVMLSVKENPLSKKSKPESETLPSYDWFVVMLGLIPNGEPLLEWLHYSLLIELGCIALDTIIDDSTSGETPSSESLEELAIIVRDAGQGFGGVARSLGLWSKLGASSIQFNTAVESSDIEEERLLAEAGFSDFANSFQ
jgi:hypothetical protein